MLLILLDEVLIVFGMNNSYSIQKYPKEVNNRCKHIFLLQNIECLDTELFNAVQFNFFHCSSFLTGFVIHVSLLTGKSYPDSTLE